MNPIREVVIETIKILILLVMGYLATVLFLCL